MRTRLAQDDKQEKVEEEAMSGWHRLFFVIPDRLGYEPEKIEFLMSCCIT
jgi:hypothetical protein